MRSSFLVALLAAFAFCFSSCATALVRPDPQMKKVYPASALDVSFFVDGAIKGEPAFTMADPEVRAGVVSRLFFGLGSIVDLPISIVIDTVLLPFDLWSLRGEDESDFKDE